MLKDNVLLKEIPRPFCISDVSSAGTFENFSRCFAGIFLLLFFFFVVVFRFFFFLFVFVPCGKSSVSSYDVLVFFFLFKISCWDFFFIPGVHSRARG